MDGYLSWNEKTIRDFTDKNTNAQYNRGFVFTRVGKGCMTETRSVRVNLSKFELSSENRRILRKTENLKLAAIPLPHPNYDWHIHKLGHDFYTRKFGEKTFSANKIKELLTSPDKSNFNLLLKFSNKEDTVGYAICFASDEWLHYAYPFYNLDVQLPNLGIGMMTRALMWAKERGKKYVCLGSAQNAAAIYKLQFAGVEWWDGKQWNSDLKKIKEVIK